MKKRNGVIILMTIVLLVAVFVACSSKPAYTDKEVTLTQAVTNENGEAVTDSNGEVVTEQANGVVVTDANGQTVTEVVTQSNGQAVTKPNGEKVTQAVTVAPSSTNTTTTTKKNNESPSKDKTTENNQNSSTSTTKKNDKEPTKKPNPTNPSVTDPSTTEPTTLPPTTAVGDDEIEKGDVKVKVILPYFATEDANKYNLYVKIEEDTLKFPINDGCRGQEIEITVPKEYRGKNATFSINVHGKPYTLQGKIKTGLKLEFETVIIVNGDDD